MRRVIFAAMVVVPGLFLGGCTPEQRQGFEETLRIQQTTIAAAETITAIWRDSNLTTAEKEKATAVVVAEFAEKTELISREEKSNFVAIAETAFATYLAWKPEKMTIAGITAAVALAIAILKKQKTDATKI